jgi:hypothetical protein
MNAGDPASVFGIEPGPKVEWAGNAREPTYPAVQARLARV